MVLNKIVIASDHSGYELKTKIVAMLTLESYKVVDLGPNNSDVVDYPDFADALCEYMIESEGADGTYGILICGTGIGMSISANRHSGIRAALVTSAFMAERARLHNDANVLVLGSKNVDDDTNLSFVKKFLSTNFEGGRHIQRLAKIS